MADKLMLCYSILLHIGGIVAVIVFLVAVWRLAKAHQRIARILGEHFLGEKPEYPLPSRPFKDCVAPCLSCGNRIPAGTTRCSKCGWSYEDRPSEVVQRLKDEGKL